MGKMPEILYVKLVTLAKPGPNRQGRFIRKQVKSIPCVVQQCWMPKGMENSSFQALVLRYMYPSKPSM